MGRFIIRPAGGSIGKFKKGGKEEGWMDKVIKKLAPASQLARAEQKKTSRALGSKCNARVMSPCLRFLALTLVSCSLFMFMFSSVR